MKDKYIECECGTHILKVSKDDSPDKSNPFYYLMMYNYGTPKYSWRSKLRTIWKIIRTGSPYDDQIVLTQSQINKIAKFIKP